MSNEENLSVPAPAGAKEEIAAALKTGKARGKFRSVEEVVAEGLKAGEKEPSSEAKAEAKAEQPPTPMPEEINIIVDDETGARTEELVGQPPEEKSAKKEAVTEEEKPAKSAAKKIKIGEKEFTNEDEAITYAQELENQRIIDEAFRQGIEAAQQLAPSNLNPAVTAKPAEEEKIPDIYYTNPAAYLKQREQEILAKATQNITAQFEAQRAHEKTMSKFWSDHPDLARSQATMDLAGAILMNAAQTDLKNVPTEKALKIVAERARKKLAELGVTTLPTKELPSTTKQVVSSGTASTITRPKQEEKTLNFISQLKNMKKSKAEARRSR